MLALPVAAHTSGIHTRCRELVSQPQVTCHGHAWREVALSLLHHCFDMFDHMTMLATFPFPFSHLLLLIFVVHL